MLRLNSFGFKSSTGKAASTATLTLTYYYLNL